MVTSGSNLLCSALAIYELDRLTHGVSPYLNPSVGCNLVIYITY